MAIILLFAALFAYSIPSAQAASGYKVNPYQKYTYKDMQKDIAQLKKAYPGLIKVQVIGKTHYGRNIYAVALGYGKATVLINGSHHAREWLTTNLNMNMIDKYAWAYTHNQRIGNYNARAVLNNTTIWFIPMVNPDGVTLQQYGYKAFPRSDWGHLIRMNGGSMNFKRWKANAQGVDLNRQYNAGWRKPTQPRSPSYQNYNGKRPESAPEVKAVVKLIHKVNPEMEIAYHSMGRMVYWNYKQSKNLLNRNRVYAAHLAGVTHYRLVSPYGSGGMGLSDWFMDKLHRPGFTIEIGNGYSGTNLPVNQFSRIWMENHENGMYLASQGYLLYQKSLSAPLKTSQISVTNANGMRDSVHVKNLQNGDAVNVYNATKNCLATAKANGSSITFHLSLGRTSGKIYLTIKHTGKRESSKTGITYTGEQSASLQASQVQVTNNIGQQDTIAISRISKNDVVRVFSPQGNELVSGTAKSSSLILNVTKLNTESGKIYLTIQHPMMEQSSKTTVDYSAEPNEEP